MRRTASGLLVLLLLCGASLLDEGVELEYFDLAPDGTAFVVTWEARREQGVREYELLRKTPFTNGRHVKVHGARAHGVGLVYRFRDDQVYKSASEEVDYELHVVYESGVRQLLTSRPATYTPTYIRRTWGSIKAMFQ